MAINVTTFHSELESVKTAIDANDALTARKWIAKAEATLAGLADGRVGRSFITWGRAQLSSLTQQVDQIESIANAGSNRMAFRTLPTQFA